MARGGKKALKASLSALLLVAFHLSLAASPSDAAYQSSGLVTDWIGSTLVDASTAWSDSVANKALTQYNTTYSSSNGGYISFNGSSSYVMASSSNNLPTFTTTTMSMFFWIKPTSNAGVIAVLGRDSGDADSEMWFQIDSTGKLLLWDFNAAEGSTGLNSVLSSGTVTLNAWNYVGFTKTLSGSNSNVAFYINGSASGTATGGSRTISLNSFALGKDVRDDNKYFSGAIARATIWSSALSSSDVLANYQASNGIAISPSITLSNSSQSVTAYTPVATASVSNSGGAISSYSSSPSLPSGLTIDSSGNISGTPTTVRSQTTYVITATNPAGTSSVNFILTVLISNSSIAFTQISSATYKGLTSLIVNVTGYAGTVTFFQNGKRIPGCLKVPTVNSGAITATCNWKPSVMNFVALSATYAPNSPSFTSASSGLLKVFITKRAGNR